jgi:hypothetical protein
MDNRTCDCAEAFFTDDKGNRTERIFAPEADYHINVRGEPILIQRHDCEHVKLRNLELERRSHRQ